MTTEVDNLRNRAKALDEVGRYKEAIPFLHQALALAPDDADLLCRLCSAHYSLKQWKEALQYADRAIAADPESAWGHALRSQILVVRNKGRQAVKSALEAIRLAPHHADYLRPLFHAYIATNNMRKAEATAKQYRELRPDIASPYELLATVALARQKRDEAEGYLRQALALDPLSAQTMKRLGTLLMQRNRTTEAIRFYHGAVKLDPTDTHVRMALANAPINYVALPSFLFALTGPILAGLFLLVCWGAGLGWRHETIGGSILLAMFLTCVALFMLNFRFGERLISFNKGFASLPADVQETLLMLWRQRRGTNAIIMTAFGFSTVTAISAIVGLGAALLTGQIPTHTHTP